MPAFSFSAPQISKEEEQRELESLSDDERKAIAHDVCKKFALHETAESNASNLLRMQFALRSIPPERKEAYLEALARCPELVRTESKPLAFLRCENHNVPQAAERLVAYWDVRRTLFQEKAFMPMTVLGALSDDTELLTAGCVEILPGDEQGRTVILYNRCQVPLSLFDRDSMLRVMWYIIHAALENPTSQTNGFVIVVNVRSYTLEYFDRKLARRAWESVDVLPMKVQAIHACCPSHRWVIDFICPMVKVLMNKQLRHRMIIHAGTVGDVIDELENFGLSPSKLPFSLGGTMPPHGYRTWLARRRLSETAAAHAHQGEHAAGRNRSPPRND